MRVERVRHDVQVAVAGVGLAHGLWEVVELELVLVFRPQIVERAEPAVLGEGLEGGVAGIDDVGGVGLRRQRDGRQFQRLVDRHQLGVDGDARDRGAHLLGVVFQRGIAVADHLDGAGRAGLRAQQCRCRQRRLQHAPPPQSHACHRPFPRLCCAILGGERRALSTARIRARRRSLCGCIPAGRRRGRTGRARRRPAARGLPGCGRGRRSRSPPPG